MSITTYFTPGKLAFCPYLMTGYPDTETYFQALDLLVRYGAKILEPWVPFSDPGADWPLLTQINHEMIQKGTTIHDSLALMTETKKHYPQLGLCLMTYANLVMQYGYEKFYQYLADHHIDSFLLPDIPVAEYDNFWTIPDTVQNIMIVSNNLDNKKIKAISDKTTGYLYVMSFVGTTWSDISFHESLRQFVLRIRSVVWPNKKLVVWFGIKTKEDVAFLRTIPIDGFIIWSEIAKQLKEGGVQWLEKYLDSLELI
jgi:tryptophan synthase alpha chain